MTLSSYKPEFKIEYFDISIKENYNPIWNFFVKDQYSFIYCISLHESVKRRNRAKQCVFEQLKIPVNWFLTEHDKRGPKYGCHYSHQKIMKDAYDKGADRVLIFEDDVTISPRFSWCNLQKSISFMKKSEGAWEFFMFSINHTTVWECNNYTGDPNIINPFAGGGTAYVVPRKNMESLKEFEFYNVEYDKITHICKNKYVIYPMLFQPHYTDSTLNNNWYNYLGCVSRFFHLIFEWYAVKINIPIIYWVYLFVFVLIIVLSLK